LIIPLIIYSEVFKGICWLIIDEFNESIIWIKNCWKPLPPSNDGENWILNEDDVISDTRISVGVSGLPLQKIKKFFITINNQF
jgi:hypothetical protein